MKFLSFLYTIVVFRANSQPLLTKKQQNLRRKDPPSRNLDSETTPVTTTLKGASCTPNTIFYRTNVSSSP